MTGLRKRQQGLTSIEFAIVGLTILIILFGAIEVGRMMFTLNMLGEATRRGARVAVVCPVNDAAIGRAAVFNTSGSGATGNFLPNLSTANIEVDYLDQNGVVLANPADATVFIQIRYVRVQIANYSYQFFLPGRTLSFTTQAYPTTLPKESLGIPRPGETTTCT